MTINVLQINAAEMIRNAIASQTHNAQVLLIEIMDHPALTILNVHHHVVAMIVSSVKMDRAWVHYNGGPSS